jgi:hypothetical protein
MTKKQAEGLRLSIERFGFAVPFLVSPDGDIYDGHQRQALMNAIKEYGPNATVDVRVSSRPLDDDERRELVVRLKQNQAGWDFDMLPNLYEREELLAWGFEDWDIGGLDIIGMGEDDTGANRQTNNMGIIGKGENVGLQFGDIMVVVDRELYDRVWLIVDSPDWPDRKAGMMQILEAGLANIGHD